MRFALLGTDSESLSLAQAAVAAGHTIDWCGDVAAHHSLDANWPRTDLGDEWEVLLDQNRVDAVLVGRGRAGGDMRGAQVIQLIKNGVPILATFPLFDSVLTYYEIDMARTESQTTVQHFNPLTEPSPTIKQCADWIAHEHPQLGPIEQVVWDRSLAERTQSQVLWNFARDVELLNVVAGRLYRLGALGSPAEATTYSGLSIQLLGETEVPVRWQVGPVEHAVGAQLILIAAHGKSTVAFSEAGRVLRLSVSHDGETVTTELNALPEFAAPNGVDAAALSVGRFFDKVARRDSTASSWPDALHAMELTDTIEISLRRGRMIEVHQQQLTEDLAFKGTMSALGCGVLLVGPPLLLLAGWLAELVGLSVARFWPHVLLTFLALFLGLQLIPKLLFDNANKHANTNRNQKKNDATPSN